MKKQTILIVDDSPVNIDILKGVLGDEYNIKAATNGEVALKIARNLRPDLILLDIMMPEMDGYEVCSWLKANIETQNIPVIFITAKDKPMDETHGFEVGAVDYITKPISPPVVLARVRTHLALHDQNQELERLVKERTKELLETQLEVIRRLGRAAEYRDDETGMHVIRMSNYAYEIALEIGLDKQEAELILNVVPMHDVGKIGIPDAILLKPGKLTPEEWEIMKKHTEYGARIIGDHPSKILKAAKIVALTHHEKWDGTGYPNGLAGEDIPLIGRICAVADVFDALTSKRPYKEAWDIEKAVNLILEEKGKHFDPILVDAFEKVLPSIIKIKEQYPDSG